MERLYSPIIRGGERGYAAVLTPTGPIWIPACCVLPVYHEMASGAAQSSQSWKYLQSHEDAEGSSSTTESFFNDHLWKK